MNGSAPFYTVWRQENGVASRVEIQAAGVIDAFGKACKFYPDADRILVVV